MSFEIDKELTHAIYQTLQTVVGPDATLIEQAQKQLKVLQIRQEYSLVLTNILIDQSVEFPVRQLAGVLFKQFVEVHWSQNSEKFEEPEIDGGIKQHVKQILPVGLGDQNSKIRSVVAYAIAIISHFDWPELWPELFGILITALNGHGIVVSAVANQQQSASINLHAVHGALETLTEIVKDVTDLQMPQIAPVLIPQVYKIFIDPQNYSVELRKRTIEIFRTVIDVIAEMSDYDSTAGKKYLFPFMNDFVFAMIKVLSLGPQEAAGIVDDCLKKEIIETITSMLKAFPKKLTNLMNDILTQVWNCLVQSSQVYVNRVVNSASKTNDFNESEDEMKNLENLVYQLFEFILVLKEKSRYKMIVKKAIDELCYYTVLYMQITDSQIESWADNAEQFVQDEDEESYSYSVRIAGQELIDGISNDYKIETAAAISKAIHRHMEHAQKLRAANDPSWWKLHESCLVAVSNVKEILIELNTAGSLEFDLSGFVNQIVIGCLHESTYPFLVGRALFTASCFPKFINPETLETLLTVTANALQENQNPIIRVSAMKSIYCFCEEFMNEQKQQIVVPLLPRITDGLVQMITENATNQVGSLTMETLVTVLTVDEQFVASVEAKVTPLAIALFLKNTNDPLVHSIIIELIKVLVNNKFVNAKVEQRLMPTLISIINVTATSKSEFNNESKDYSSLLTSTLDLITTVVRSSTQTPLSDLVMTAFPHVVTLCIKSDETAILQSGGECLRAYISKSVDQVINWKDDKGQSALNYIVHVINHMLDPKTSENSCSFIGKFINTLIRHTAPVLGDNLDSILKAVLSKMQSSNVLLVQQSLIMVFAHLIHSKMDAVLAFLSNLPGPTGKPVFEFLLSEWVSKQNSFVGSYETKVSILALAKLLEHAISTDDMRFQNIFVRGDRIINPVEGVKTRSKTKTEKELYTQVPLLVKIYKLLINEVHGLIEERKEELDEEYEDDDGEYDEEDEEDLDENDEDENDDGIKDGIEVDENGDADTNYLSKHDLFKEAFDNEELVDEYDPDAAEDPLNKVDLLEFLTNYLSTLSKHPCYSVFVEHHNQLEKEVLKEVGITNI